jgi:hypothetical protein
MHVYNYPEFLYLLLQGVSALPQHVIGDTPCTIFRSQGDQRLLDDPGPREAMVMTRPSFSAMEFSIPRKRA